MPSQSLLTGVGGRALDPVEVDFALEAPLPDARCFEKRLAKEAWTLSFVGKNYNAIFKILQLVYLLSSLHLLPSLPLLLMILSMNVPTYTVPIGSVKVPPHLDKLCTDMTTDTPAKFTESCPLDHLWMTLNIMGPCHFSSLSVAHFSQGRYGIQIAATFTLFKVGVVLIHCVSGRDLSSSEKLSCHIGRMLSSG